MSTGNEPLLPAPGRLLGLAGARLAATVERVSGIRYGVYGLAVLRVGYGLVLLALLLTGYTDRRLIWGPESAWTPDLFKESLAEDGTFSLFAISDSGVWFEVLFHVFLLVVVLFILGWRTRWITPVLAVLVWSWHQRQPWVLDGGDNLMQLVLFYLIFADLSARWSLDDRRRVRRAAARAAKASAEPAPAKRDRSLGEAENAVPGVAPGLPAFEGGLRWRLATIGHNAALVATLLQVSIVYFNAGLLKVQGEMWQQGTALYYTLRTDEFAPFPRLSRLIWENDLAVASGSYFAVFIQLAFPLLMLNRITRRLGLVAVTSMHLGIGVLMGLGSFSLIMVFSDLLFVRSGTYRRVGAFAQAVWHRTRTRTRLSATPSLPKPAKHRTLTGS
ncbi:HTTM domain-containing protein [Rhizohabitans arisaemae]|uniref:HTTM domain-containing protein n=1 Tax=Rhizohabitans arisaemae TaxID=2720610 RepID=UPI0024B1F5EB|nr:HTTM domain-containing protein [Rhizohabitans arisaemae]